MQYIQDKLQQQQSWCLTISYVVEKKFSYYLTKNYKTMLHSSIYKISWYQHNQQLKEVLITFFPGKYFFHLGLRWPCLQTGGAHGCPKIPATLDHFRGQKHLQTLPSEKTSKSRNQEETPSLAIWKVTKTRFRRAQGLSRTSPLSSSTSSYISVKTFSIHSLWFTLMQLHFNKTVQCCKTA